MLETSNVLGSGSPSEMLIGRMAKLLPSILIGNPCKSRLTQTLNQLSLSSPCYFDNVRRPAKHSVRPRYAVARMRRIASIFFNDVRRRVGSRSKGIFVLLDQSGPLLNTLVPCPGTTSLIEERVSRPSAPLTEVSLRNAPFELW